MATYKENLRALWARQDRNLDFVVNVIMCQHRNPARKMRGLLALVEAGAVISIGPEMRLAVNGQLRAWVELEMPVAKILEVTL